MSNDKFFNALMESETPPAENAGGITLNDLQAFEKRIAETITARIDERIKEATTPPTMPENTPPATPENTTPVTPDTSNNESEEK